MGAPQPKNRFLALTSSAAAAAEALHFSLSGGAGIAHGIAGLKFEVQYGPVAAFAGLGLVRPAAGVRYYFGRSERGAGFVSLDYAHYNDSWYDRSCCEFYDDTENSLGAVLGYRFRYPPGPGFVELGIGPAWTWVHEKGLPPTGAAYDRREFLFGMASFMRAVPNFVVAVGVEL